MARQRVLVVGGGFGDVAAARTARALLDRAHGVTLIPNPPKDGLGDSP